MWEKIDEKTRRMSVPGGWVVWHYTTSSIVVTDPVFGSYDKSLAMSESMVFVPDSEHAWVINQEAK